jgi:hypothetical protein
MDSLSFTAALREGLWAVLLLLIASAVFYAVLAREKSAALAAAIGRRLLSFFTSPWGYLRKTIGEVALGKANPRLQGTDYYLLSQFIHNVQVGLVVAVVLGGGLVVTSAVFSALPPQYLRESLATAQDQLDQAEKTASQTEDAVKKQDQDWQTRSADLIRNAEEERRQKVTTATNAIAGDENALQNSPEAQPALQGVKNFFQSHEGDPSAAAQARDFIQRLPSLSEPQTAALLAYCDHWAALQAASRAAPKGADALRARVQPDHASLVEQLDTQKQEAAELQARVTGLESEVHAGYKPENFALAIGVGAFMMLLWIWVLGLAIELFSMGFYLANDIKQIRSEVEKPDVKAKAAAGVAG